jgi:hypothetical protein
MSKYEPSGRTIVDECSVRHLRQRDTPPWRRVGALIADLPP